MERADAQRASQRFQRDGIVGMGIDITADLFDELRVGIGRIGLASFAGPEARALGRFARPKENHVFAAGPLGGARRTAIDAGRCHGVEKHAIQGAIPSGNCVPVVHKIMLRGS